MYDESIKELSCDPSTCCVHGPTFVRMPFYFVDETGIIKNKKDPFFAFGAVKIYTPQNFYNEMRRIRSRHSLYGELKWNEVSEQKYTALKEIFELFFQTKQISFSSVILNKNELDLEKHFNKDFWKAYCSFMILLLKGPMAVPGEIATILADDYFSPSEKNIESQVRNKINNHFGRLVVGGCCQVNSKSTDLIQVTDLLLGSIMYDLKITEGIVQPSMNAKTKLLSYIHDRLGVPKSMFLDRAGKRQRKFHSGQVNVMIFDPKHTKT